MQNREKLVRLLMVFLMIGVITAVASQLFYFLFGIWWLSIGSAIASQILLSYLTGQFIYARKIRASLDNYDKLEYRKYPAEGIHCAACKAPNDLTLDWNTVGFKCRTCGVENGLEIQLNPYIRAINSETISLDNLPIP